jgi:hypothetical protein
LRPHTTLFSVPKPFRGHTGTIQRNALRSWAALGNGFETLLFGNEEGVAAAAGMVGARHVEGLARNEFGTPLLDEVFVQATAAATGDMVSFVNADIVLLNDFAHAVETMCSLGRRFLLIGSRWNLEVREELAFDEHWEKRLRERVEREAVLQPPCWIDYFVFPKDLFGRIPPFAIGRPGYDNWLIYRARQLGAIVVDATSDVVAVHQNHDYGRLGTLLERSQAPESQRNLELAGSPEHLFSLEDCTHVLRRGRVRPALRRLRRRLVGTAVLFPRWRALLRGVIRVVDVTHAARARLGLALNPTRRRGTGEQGDARRSDRHST